MNKKKKNDKTNNYNEKISIVYKLNNTCDFEELKIGNLYIGIVDTIVEKLGAFIKINENIKGLMHEKNIYSMPKKNENVIVFLKDIKYNGKDTKLDLVQKNISNYNLVEIKKELKIQDISTITKNQNGNVVMFNGEVLQVKQTGGPTIFTIIDHTGSIQCAGFTSAGKRSFIDINNGMIVFAIGVVNIRDDLIQIELSDMKEIIGDKADNIKQKINASIDIKSEPYNVDFLVKSDILEKLKPSMLKAAKEIRKAILKSRPIILRHHADADGITAGIAIEKAILPLIEKINGIDTQHFYRRSPSKAPFYELTDVVKDISFAIEDNIRFGEPLPLIIMVDNGSTTEDYPSYLHTSIYNIDIIVIDHHYPNEIVDQYLLSHVNPYKVGGDFGLTAGMLCTEIARMINKDITEKIKHFPSISGVGDRSEANELNDYIKLIDSRYTRQDLKDIALALDYEQYWLKFGTGIGIIDDILDLRDHNIHKKIVSMLCEQARTMINEQLEVCLPNLITKKLDNDILLNTINIELFSHKFTFPAPGITSGEIHDKICSKYPKSPVITLGLGPDFIVIRSKKVLMNIPNIIQKLKEELVGSGVSGGGHLVVGSMKFVEGARDIVLKKLIEILNTLKTEII